MQTVPYSKISCTTQSSLWKHKHKVRSRVPMHLIGKPQRDRSHRREQEPKSDSCTDEFSYPLRYEAIKWVRNPPSSTHTIPATSRSSDRGRRGKKSQGPIQHGPILYLPAASHSLMKRPRSLSGAKPQRRGDTVRTIVHPCWTNANASRGDKHLPRQ